MAERKDGGPAFPSVGEGFGNLKYSAPGMTLRDWFAGQALAGLAAGDSVPAVKDLAKWSFVVADAMLEARNG